MRQNHFKRDPLCALRGAAVARLFSLLTALVIASAPAVAERKGGAARPHLPASQLLDFSNTLETPAGQHGLLTVGTDGHFRWADGTRARFWGVNVSSTRLNVPDDQIEETVSLFARAGLNLVRLEAIDNRNCLLGSVDAPDSLHFDYRYLDKLDRWMDALRRHGLYYYLDLLDFRTFKAGDGVLNADALDRGARPYAVFDPYLIQLQKDYATRLLHHTNPYSGLRPVDDPALAMVEICNENGFFLYPEKLETLAEPYRRDLRIRWNQWLEERYGSRDKLDAAWGTVENQPVLQPGEAPGQQTVDLPMLASPAAVGAPPPTGPDVRRAATRLRDGVEFLSEMQRAYFRTMRDHLRSIGLRVPVTGVVSNDIIPDVASAAEECDFTAENWYGDSDNTDPKMPGAQFYSNHNPLRSDTTGGFAPFTAALRWNSKPVVIREWGIPWPNQWRAASVPEVLAYSSLQDYDAVLLFGYQTNRALNGSEADALNDLAFQSDPTVWGLEAIAGQAFLRGAIKPANRELTLAFPPDRRYTWPNRLCDLHRAAWTMRLNSTPGDSGAPLTIVPGSLQDDLRALKTLVDPSGASGAPWEAQAAAAGVWRSDTGQIGRYVRDGRLQVIAPTLRMLAGELTPGRIYDLGGGIRFSTPTPFGALILYSLDSLPVEKSRHLVAKMVSLAENTGQQFEKAPPGSVSEWVLRSPGAAPVITLGKASSRGTHLWIAGRAAAGKGKPAQPARDLINIALVNGDWEMEMRNGRARLTCDTPGITGALVGQAFVTPIKPEEITSSAAVNHAHSGRAD